MKSRLRLCKEPAVELDAVEDFEIRMSEDHRLPFIFQGEIQKAAVNLK